MASPSHADSESTPTTPALRNGRRQAGGGPTRRRTALFIGIAVLLAALFVRLGVWQLDRLEERRALNEAHESRLALPPISMDSLEGFLPPADSMAWRRLRARGAFDYERELVLRSRSLRGRPGVYVVTPLRRAGKSAILVLRGFLPAADGLHADLEAARPPETSPSSSGAGRPPRTSPSASGGVDVRGVAFPGAEIRRFTPVEVELAGETHVALGSLVIDDARDALPYPVAPFYVHTTTRPPGAGSPAESSPVLGMRLVPLPERGEGRHLVYAIQWFAFAAIALVGTAIYTRRG